MISITAHDEFKALEHAQKLAADVSQSEEMLATIERAFKCRAFLIEIDSNNQHTSRFTDAPEAGTLLSLLKSISTEDNHTAFCFLVAKAALKYPYCKYQLLGEKQVAMRQEFGDIVDWPGLISPVYRSQDKTILFACMWNSLSKEQIDADYVTPPFQRLVKTLANSCEVVERGEEVHARKSLLENAFALQEQSLCIIDTDRNLKLMTQSFTELTQDSDLFDVVQGQLQVKNKELESCLQNAISDKGRFSSLANLAPYGFIDTTQSIVSISDRKFMRVSFRRLSKPSEHNLEEGTPHILIEARASTGVSENMKSVLKNTFHLSQGEVRLAYDLATSGSLNETLNNLNITRNTAKTHLRRIYEKTGVQTQVDLMRLIFRLAGMY